MDILSPISSSKDVISKEYLESLLGDYQPLLTAINTGNIGNQSVAYAASAGAVSGIPLTYVDADGIYNGLAHMVGGVLEIGKYIDFHASGSTKDYSVRLNCSNDNGVSIHLPSASGTLALSSQIPTSTSQLTEGSNLYFTNARAVTALTDTLKGYLALTGGTISGPLTINSSLTISGTLKIGSATLTYDSTTGALKIDKPIFSSSYAAGATATSGGTTDSMSDYLPLTGGVLKGTLTLEGASLHLGNERPLYFKDNAGSNRNGLYISAGNNMWLGYDNRTDIKACIAGSEVRLYYGGVSNIGILLSTSGNVGIGTASPAYKLDVVGTARITSSVEVPYMICGGQSTGCYFGSAAAGVGAAGGGLVYTYGNMPLWFYVGGASAMSIGSDRGVTMESYLAVKSTAMVSSVICGTGRLRVNASDTAINFGYMKAETYSTNRGVLRIGTNYGGSETITNAGVDVDAINIYRGVVGIGGTIASATLYSNQSAGVSLFVNGSSHVNGNLAVSSAFSADGTAGVAGVFVRNEGGIEICHASTPYIDFHYANSTVDFTARLLCDSAGRLKSQGPMLVAGMLQVSDDCRPLSNITYLLGSESYRWHTVFAQNGNYSGTVTQGSDIRFKSVVNDIILEVNDIASAPLFTFRWNDRADSSLHLGSSAQYWENVVPWVVTGNDFKSMDYAALGVAMGISLSRKVLDNETRIKQLEATVASQAEEIRQLRNQLSN